MDDSAADWISDMEDDRQRSEIRISGRVYGDDGSAALPTSTWQAAGAGDGAQGDQRFGYTQEYLHPLRQYYEPAHFQGPISQEQFPQDNSGLAFKAPAQSLYDDVPSYQSRQPTIINDVPKPYNFAPSSLAGDDGRVTGLGTTSREYSTALYRQALQYNNTTALEHPTIASSDRSTELGQAVGAEPANQLQRENYGYDYVYSQFKKMNEDTIHGRLVAAVETLSGISKWLVRHAADLVLVWDIQASYSRRLKLMEDFNHCWLALLQRQLSETQETREPQQESLGARNILTKEDLVRLGDEITSQCDEWAPSGLVDYQMGVWEEEIVDMMSRCLDNLSSDDGIDENNKNGNDESSDAR